MSVRAEIRQHIAAQLGVEPEALRNDASIVEDLGADSLDVVELVMALEEAYDLHIPDEDVADLRTIGEVETYLVKRLDGSALPETG